MIPACGKARDAADLGIGGREGGREGVDGGRELHLKWRRAGAGMRV